MGITHLVEIQQDSDQHGFEGLTSATEPGTKHWVPDFWSGFESISHLRFACIMFLDAAHGSSL
jgi:hypothetical protein